MSTPSRFSTSSSTGGRTSHSAASFSNPGSVSYYHTPLSSVDNTRFQLVHSLFGPNATHPNPPIPIQHIIFAASSNGGNPPPTPSKGPSSRPLPPPTTLLPFLPPPPSSSSGKAVVPATPDQSRLRFEGSASGAPFSSSSSSSSSSSVSLPFPLYNDFGCSLEGRPPLGNISGRLYTTPYSLCFYSNLFGFERKLCVRLEDILSVDVGLASAPSSKGAPILSSKSSSMIGEGGGGGGSHGNGVGAVTSSAAAAAAAPQPTVAVFSLPLDAQLSDPVSSDEPSSTPSSSPFVDDAGQMRIRVKSGSFSSLCYSAFAVKSGGTLVACDRPSTSSSLLDAGVDSDSSSKDFAEYVFKGFELSRRDDAVRALEWAVRIRVLGLACGPSPASRDGSNNAAGVGAAPPATPARPAPLQEPVPQAPPHGFPGGKNVGRRDLVPDYVFPSKNSADGFYKASIHYEFKASSNKAQQQQHADLQSQHSALDTTAEAIGPGTIYFGPALTGAVDAGGRPASDSVSSRPSSSSVSSAGSDAAAAAAAFPERLDEIIAAANRLAKERHPSVLPPVTWGSAPPGNLLPASVMSFTITHFFDFSEFDRHIRKIAAGVETQDHRAFVGRRPSRQQQQPPELFPQRSTTASPCPDDDRQQQRQRAGSEDGGGRPGTRAAKEGGVFGAVFGAFGKDNAGDDATSANEGGRGNHGRSASDRSFSFDLDGEYDTIPVGGELDGDDFGGGPLENGSGGSDPVLVVRPRQESYPVSVVQDSSKPPAKGGADKAAGPTASKVGAKAAPSTPLTKGTVLFPAEGAEGATAEGAAEAAAAAPTTAASTSPAAAASSDSVVPFEPAKDAELRRVYVAATKTNPCSVLPLNGPFTGYKYTSEGDIVVPDPKVPGTNKKECDVLAFFDLFFGDDAKFGMPLFHTLLKDSEIEIEKWKAVSGDASVSARATLAKQGQGTFSRNIKFTHPVTAPIGPNKTKGTKRQRLSVFGRQGFMVDTSVILHDIPSGDCFTVEDRYMIERIAPSGGAGESVKLSVTFEVKFVKFTMWKAVIEKMTKDETLQVQEAYKAFLNKNYTAEYDADRVTIAKGIPGGDGGGGNAAAVAASSSAAPAAGASPLSAVESSEPALVVAAASPPAAQAAVSNNSSSDSRAGGAVSLSKGVIALLVLFMLTLLGGMGGIAYTLRTESVGMKSEVAELRLAIRELKDVMAMQLDIIKQQQNLIAVAAGTLHESCERTV